MKKITTIKQKYLKGITLILAVVFVFGAIFWIDSKAEDTPTKYNVEDYKGETSYPTKEGKVFAGWYQDAEYTKVYTEETGEAYAKFVDADVLRVKKQMRVKDANATNTNGIRFLTAIDSRRFAKVVFSVEVPEQGKTYELEETVAYSSMMVEGVSEPQLPADVFGTSEAKYFVAHSLTGIPLGASDSVFRITPYWYTLDGKKVAGTSAAFTVDEALVADSLFADTLTVNGVQLDSAVSKWDLSEATNRILKGSYSMGSSLAPMYFSQTGEEMVLHTTMAYSTVFEEGGSYQGDLMGGIYVSDGTNTNYFGVRQHGVVYGSSFQWISNAWPYCVMSTWEKPHLTAEVDIALKDGVFYIYVDGIYHTTLNLSTLMPNTSSDKELAFGLTMHADKTSDIQFSDIQFTTDTEQVGDFLESDTIFAGNVTVNGKTVQSGVSYWDCSEIDNRILKGSYAMGTSKQPMYFEETGTAALLRTTIRVTEVSGDPMAGIYVSDGTNTGYVCVRDHGLCYSPSDGWVTDLWPGKLSSWGDATVDVDIVLKDGNFYIYVDDIYSTTFPLATIMPNTASNTELAFGLTMGAWKTCSMEFSDIQFTTDAKQVDAFLSSKTLFADSVTVNGTTLNSAKDKWNTRELDKLILKGSQELGSSKQPMYFTEIGSTALLQTTITCTTDYAAGGDVESSPMAGLMVHDGTNRGFFFVREHGLVFGRWLEWKSNVLPYTAFASWNEEHPSVHLDVALKDGAFYIYLDGLYATTLSKDALSETGASLGSNFAFALTMYSEGGKSASMEFSNIKFTTDAAAVNAFLGSDIVLENYGTGLGDDLQYNSDFYGMNQSNDVEGADPGVFYVSPEEDATYGGYYYMYQTGSTRDDGVEVGPINGYAFRCYRSKDLYQWELCGTFEQGYSLQVDWGDWAMDAFWAPEVIRNPQDGKYYMYFSAGARPDWGVAGMSSSSTWSDRLYLGVAVADTPVGPFDMLYDTDATTGKRMPTINFHTGCNTTYDWAAIDASPFFDDDGTLYLYFNKHTDSHYGDVKGVWGMKMNSMTTPDYSTVSYLAKPHKYSVANTAGNIESYTSVGAIYEWVEGNINEAPFMVKHNGKYYLTYASNGFSAKNYSVHQAISTSPLGGFTKLSSSQGNPVLDGSVHGGSSYNYMNGTAHHSIVQKGDEMWIVYHRHNSTKGVDEGMDRSICADRVQFVTNSEGTDVLTANGPSMSLQWLPESVSGYTNLAPSADITISTGSGKEYLTDELLPFYTVVQNRVMSATSDVTVTLKWDEAVSVSSVMIYNAYNEANVFSEVTNLRFKLADGWENRYATISELEFPVRYMSNSVGAFVPCAPAVAEFDALSITELQFTIPVNGTIHLSEVVVLGNAEKRLTNIKDYDSFSTVENDSSVKIDGALDETVWEGKKWFSNTYVSNMDGTLPTLKATGFTTTKGIYIASVVKDSNIVNDGQHTMTTNSAFDFRIAAGDTSSKKAWQTYHIMIDMLGDVHCDGAGNFKRVVNVDSDTATVEIFIPWAYLGVDTTQEVPTEFSMFPSYRAVLSNSSTVTDMGCAYGVTANDVNNYWKFDATGYQSGDWRGALVGDSSTGLTKIGTWDVSKEHEKTVATCGNSTKHTIFFRYMYGANFIAEATISKNGTIGNGNPVAGFFFLDTNGNTHTTLVDLAKYPNGGDLTVIKFGDTFRFYINGMLLKEEKIADFSGEVFSALYAENAKVTFEDYSCKTISEAKLQEYLTAHIFAQEVTINGATVSSVTDKWNLGSLTEKVVTAYSAGANEPLYFVETGNTALVQMTVTRIDDLTMSNRESQPMAGIKVSDGTTSGFIGIRRGCIVYGSTWVEGAIGKDLFTTWAPANATANISIVLKDNQFQFYVDGVFKKTVNVSDAIPGIQDDAELAIGLLMNSEANYADMKFSNVNYTTDVDEVDAFIKLSKSIFANSVNVNGTTVKSALDRWIYNAENISVTGTDTTADAFYMAPIYFSETGTSMVLQTTITNISDPVLSRPFAGLYVTDGTYKGGFGIHHCYIKYGEWLNLNTDIGASYLSADDMTRLSVKYEVALKDGYFYVYVNDVFAVKLALNSVVYKGTPSGELAFGLTMNGLDVGANKVSMKFSDINFSTKAADVEKFFLEKAGFAESVQVNGAIVTSKLANWDYSDIFNGNLRGTTDLGCNNTPMYFAETGTEMVMKTKVSFASTGKETMVGVYVTDGSNSGFAGVRGWKILTNKGWYPDDSTNTWTKYYFAPSGWGGVLNAEVTIAYKDQYLYFFVDGVLGRKVPITNVISSATADTKLAFGLVVNPETTYDATFSNTTFTTDPVKVNEFFLVDSPLFVKEVSVNGKTVQSSLPKWTYDSTELNAIGTGTTTTSFAEPILFNKTGTTMLLQTTVTNVSNPIKNQPFAGLYITDGTNKGGLGVLASELKGGQWLSGVATLQKSYLSQWDSNPSVQLEIALKDKNFYAYVDGLYVTKVGVDSVMYPGTSSGDFAFGLSMRSEAGQPTSIKFSNITFTTDATAVDAFLAGKASAQ